MATKLTKKEKGFVKDYLKTGNGTQAVLKNYDTKNENTAATIAYENLRKPKILSAVEGAFPDDELYALHREGLYDEDLSIRHRYLDTAYKLKGSYAAEKHLNVNMDVEASDEIKQLAQTLNDIHRGTNIPSDGTSSRTLGEEVQD